jgi:hypothetical protein
VYTGPFTLPVKTGEEWITVRTGGALPEPGTPITPVQAPTLTKLLAGSKSVIQAEAGAHHFRFVGLEMRPTAGTFLYNLVDLTGATHVILDRCYLHGDEARGTRRGLALNGANLAVIDSYLADFKERGADSQAVAAWDADGPLKIVGNYLEAASENILLGGADPTVKGRIPSDIEIRRNRVSKPLAWRGAGFNVKNILELKNARRVLIEGNLFEYSWGDAQDGFAILFTVRNEKGTAPWSAVEDVTFRHNLVRHAAGGINFLGTDNLHPSGRTQRVLVENNLFEDVAVRRWGGGGNGNLFQFVGGPRGGTAEVAIVRNTALATENAVIMADGPPHQGFVFLDNLVAPGNYGIFGSGVGSGAAALAQYFPGSRVTNNVFAPRAQETPGVGVDLGALRAANPYAR